MRTPRASATAPRMLFRSKTERTLPYPRAKIRDTSSADLALLASNSGAASPAARRAFRPIERAAKDISRMRNDGSTADKSAASSRPAGRRATSRASASARTLLAESSLSRSGRPSRPSSVAALSSSADITAASTARFSSAHGPAATPRASASGTAIDRNHSSSSTRNASASADPVAPVGRCGVDTKVQRTPATASLAAPARSAISAGSPSSSAAARPASARHALASASRGAGRGAEEATTA